MVISQFEFIIGDFKESFKEELEIKPSSLTFVCGDSGSGKSLFVNHIYKAHKKDIFISQTNSYPPLNYSVEELLSFLTIKENSIDSFLEYIKKYFDLRPYLKKKLKNLSGGEKSFINLICSLFSCKDIIILDEPLNMISEDNRKKAVDLILEVSRSKRIIIVSHFKELFIPVADYCIEFTNGDGKIIKNKYQEKSIENKMHKLKSAGGKRTKRYLKDDLPLIGLFFIFTLCIQFILFFSIANNDLNHRDVSLEASSDYYHFNRLKASINNNKNFNEYDFDEIVKVEYGFSLKQLEKVSTSLCLPSGCVAGENLDIYTSFSFLGNKSDLETKTNKEINDLDKIIFGNNNLRRASSTCRGKCDEILEGDEVLVGNEMSGGIKSIVEKHDFSSSPLEITWIKNNSWKYDRGSGHKSVEEYVEYILGQKWMSSDTEEFTMKIVGYDPSIDSGLFLPIVAHKMTTNPFEKLSNYLKIDNNPLSEISMYYINNSELSDGELIDTLNKKLKEEKKDYDFEYFIKDDIILKEGLERKINSHDVLSYVDDNVSRIDNFDLLFYEDEKNLCFINEDNYILNKSDDIKRLNRKYNPKTDVIVYKDYSKSLGDKLNLLGEDYVIYAIVEMKVIYNTKTYWLSIDERDILKKSYLYDQEYDGNRDITNFSVQYYQDVNIVTEMSKVKNLFKDTQKGFDVGFDNSLSDRQKDDLIQKHLEFYNDLKISRYLTLTLLILGAVGMVFIVLSTYFVFKKNYSVNKFKKNISNANYIVPLSISSIFICVVLMTCFMKSLPYYICTYYLKDSSINYVVTNKVQRTVNIISIVIILLIALYLYLRNISLAKEKKEKNYGKISSK